MELAKFYYRTDKSFLSPPLPPLRLSASSTLAVSRGTSNAAFNIPGDVIQQRDYYYSGFSGRVNTALTHAAFFMTDSKIRDERYRMPLIAERLVYPSAQRPSDFDGLHREMRRAPRYRYRYRSLGDLAYPGKRIISAASLKDNTTFLITRTAVQRGLYERNNANTILDVTTARHRKIALGHQESVPRGPGWIWSTNRCFHMSTYQIVVFQEYQVAFHRSSISQALVLDTRYVHPS